MVRRARFVFHSNRQGIVVSDLEDSEGVFLAGTDGEPIRVEEVKRIVCKRNSTSAALVSKEILPDHTSQAAQRHVVSHGNVTEFPTLVGLYTDLSFTRVLENQ